MQSPFYKLSQEERSKILDTLYTGTLAINSLFLQSLLSASKVSLINIALINFAVGTSASAAAILIKRIHKTSVPADQQKETPPPPASQEPHIDQQKAISSPKTKLPINQPIQRKKKRSSYH